MAVPALPVHIITRHRKRKPLFRNHFGVRHKCVYNVFVLALAWGFITSIYSDHSAGGQDTYEMISF